jgi:hypothetical protein
VWRHMKLTNWFLFLALIATGGDVNAAVERLLQWITHTLKCKNITYSKNQSFLIFKCYSTSAIEQYWHAWFPCAYCALKKILRWLLLLAATSTNMAVSSPSVMAGHSRNWLENETKICWLFHFYQTNISHQKECVTL